MITRSTSLSEMALFRVLRNVHLRKLALICLVSGAPDLNVYKTWACTEVARKMLLMVGSVRTEWSSISARCACMYDARDTCIQHVGALTSDHSLFYLANLLFTCSRVLTRRRV